MRQQSDDRPGPSYFVVCLPAVVWTVLTIVALVRWLPWQCILLPAIPAVIMWAFAGLIRWADLDRQKRQGE